MTIAHIEPAGKHIQKICVAYENGDIEFLCFVYKDKKGEVNAGWSGGPFFERIGMVETLKQDMFLAANK